MKMQSDEVFARDSAFRLNMEFLLWTPDSAALRERGRDNQDEAGLLHQYPRAVAHVL